MRLSSLAQHEQDKSVMWAFLGITSYMLTSSGFSSIKLGYIL